MTRYAKFKKRFNKAEHSPGDRVEKHTTDDTNATSAMSGQHNAQMIKLRKKVCLKCRKRGHSLRSCPLRDASTGKCFKCGSPDHTSRYCTLPTAATYKFATCFVCKQQGHLASQCAENPRGLYPKGGGCRFCGSVRHLVKDCDKRRGAQEGAVIAEDEFEEPAIDIQTETAMEDKAVRPAKRVVSFK